LHEAASDEITPQEKTPWAKVRTCRQLLQLEPAMLFITVEGVEPTNNAAERAIRPAVLWRRTSFGAQSQSRKCLCSTHVDGGYNAALSESERLGVFKPSLSGG